MTQKPSPFNTSLLDRLMTDAGIDVLLVTSKHNVQYMLGGHKAMFFEVMDAMGVSRYLPVLIYPRGAAHKAAYVGHRTEANQAEAEPFWIPHVRTDSWGSVDAIEKAVEVLNGLGVPARRIGVEMAFLPFDSAQALTGSLPGAELIDAFAVLEALRALKTPRELDLLREATERVGAAMAETFAAIRPGMTKRDVVQVLRQAETDRGLVFEYCLLTAGPSHNRAPSDQVIQPGDVINLDSGGNYHGYLGDIARMGVVGEPDAELIDALKQIDAVQQAAFAAIRPGALGQAVYTAAQAAMARISYGNALHFVAHGMGLVSHEIPHLTATGPVRYGDEDAARPLLPGMVLSVETTLRHPTRGFIKLEDTIAVTAEGGELFGDTIRGWNRIGAPLDA
jgi:Xaa-Pro aminopeptidase